MFKQRLLTALILAPLFLAAVVLLKPVFLAMVLALFVLTGAWEWTRLVEIRVLSLRVAYVALIALFLWAGWYYIEAGGSLLPLLTVAACWWLLALLWILNYPLGHKADGVSRLIKSVAGILVLVPAWMALVNLHTQGYQWFLYLFVLIWIADSGAYFSGRAWGRHKLAPQVSPGKSWEGVYGALVLVAVYAYVGSYWLKLPPGTLLGFILLSLLLVPVSVLGDLFESMIKRYSGAKDSGTILPGHGGVLDRIDSVTSAAPVFLLGSILLELSG